MLVIDLQLLHFAVQRPPADAQTRRRVFDVAARLVELFEDQFPFRIVDRAAHRLVYRRCRRGRRAVTQHRRRDMLRPDIHIGRQQAGALDRIFQLADITRPWVFQEEPHHLVCNAAYLRLARRLVFADEIICKYRDILLPLAQRRYLEGKDVQTVIQVAAEGLFLNRLLQVHIGTRNDADIERDRLLPPDARHLARLQDAQQVDLHLVRHIADLVQKDRAVVGQLEFAGAALALRAGERARLVAEQLALDQALGYRAAVHRHKRPAGEFATVVDRLREQFLSRTALPEQQHVRGVGACDLGVCLGGCDGGGLPDDVVKVERGGRADIFCDEFAHLRTLPEGDQQARAIA